MKHENKNKFIPIERINLQVKTYKPKFNNKKRLLLLGFVGVCLVTPFTNWLIPIVFKSLTKFKPLWVYS